MPATPTTMPPPPTPAAALTRAGYTIPYRHTYTTGQIARYLGVAPRTVAKWVDAGVLTGGRLPASKDRRVTQPSLVAFVRDHYPGVSVAGAGAAVVAATLDQGLADRVAAAAHRYGLDTAVAANARDAALAIGQGTVFVLVDLNTVASDEAAKVKALATKPVLAAVLADDDGKGRRAGRLHADFTFDRQVPVEGLSRWLASRRV